MPSQPRAVLLAELGERISRLMLGDELRLRRHLETLIGRERGRPGPDTMDRLVAEVATAEERLSRRAAGVPLVTYPEELPVSQRRDDLFAAIRDHQVVVVAGATGSGKTTQLPKICLELGRGVRGLIGHTQPRRIAARTVAERIAEELGVPLGGAVGYTVRFTDRVGARTLVRLMTDGILLAEIAHDRDLRRYDTLIVDEAHERSLNIDVILGHLTRLLPRRPDLKVVITSATIDPERFARHFDAPVVEVTGRTYPVEIRYRPLAPDTTAPDRPAPVDRDQVEAIVDAVDELVGEGPGDILVFLSGEREIRDTAEALRDRRLAGTEVLPLYARLSAAEQHAVFAPHHGRRIVLATNVAETSLTVPGIRYVVDPGTARISRYSHRLKVQRLPIEPISQASAQQRAGRCGRTSEGICIRLYAEEDFASRPAFTEPEVQRTNLASVILAMSAIGIDDIAGFPFLDPPDRRAITDGVALLTELGALDPSGGDPRARLTPVGRRLAALPLDPRLARMVLAAERDGCLHEVLVITTGLSIQDPRLRPVEHQQAADAQHRRFADPGSDFLAYLNLWEYLEESRRSLSSSAFRRRMGAEFLHVARVREWQDLYAQLRSITADLGMGLSRARTDPDRIHRSILTGLLSHVGNRDPATREYVGARNARFLLWPGSALTKKPPHWVMAAELVETSRLFARDVARVEPSWVEELASHLVRRSYSEPHWERRRAAVVAVERVTLYGLTLVAGRRVAYGSIDPELCRELFIQHALVEGDWDTRHAFFHDNRALLDDAEELEHRTRRRDIVVDDATLFDFYDQRIGSTVVSGRHFDTWWKRVRAEAPDLLDFSAAMLVTDAAETVDPGAYPDVWIQGDLRLELSYQFEPGSAADGVTVHIPVSLLNRVRADGFDWQIPGLREELVTSLIRSLPKGLRRELVPVPDTARAVLAELQPGPVPLVHALGQLLRQRTGVVIPVDAWDYGRIPDHLRATFQVEDADHRVLGEDKDLRSLTERLRPRVRTELARISPGVERTGLLDFPPGGLPRTVHSQRGSARLTGFPTLVDEGASVAIRVVGSQDEAGRSMRTGIRRLLLLAVPSPVRPALARLDNREKLALGHSPYADVPALLADAVAACVDHLVAQAGGPAWDEPAWHRLAAEVRAGLPQTMTDAVRTIAEVLARDQELGQAVAAARRPGLAAGLADIDAQRARLLSPGFASATGVGRLGDLVRYLRAAEHRVSRLVQDPGRDARWASELHTVQAAYDELLTGLPAPGRARPEVVAIRWMIEELRVGLFAQTLGTAYPVSVKRVLTAIDRAAVLAASPQEPAGPLPEATE
ncbi:MAG: ATP-dependent RNA helicase HrpA [Actinomycetes bacterium]